MKKLYLFILAIGVFAAQAQDVNITFKVDMNEITDLADGDKIFVVYDADADWNWTEYNEMTDVDSDGIYEYTLTVASDGNGASQQYSFAYGASHDNYTAWETPPAECANANDYREVTIDAGVTEEVLPAYLYGMCTTAELPSPETITTTFNVDMNDLTVIDLYDEGSVWLNINDWTEYYDMMDEDGDGIYSYDFEQVSGTTIDFKFSYQTGPDAEWDYIDEWVPEACGTDGGNRQYTIMEDSVLPAYVYGTCVETGEPGSEKVDVTFNVELEGDSVATNGIWLVTKGPWSWHELTETQDNVYSATIRLFAGQSIPYSYVYGGINNWDGEESLPAECNNGTEEAPERLFAGANENTELPIVTFGMCDRAVSVQASVNNAFNVYPNPAQDILFVDLGSIDANSVVKVINVEGKEVFTKLTSNQNALSIDLAEFNNGLYFIKITAQENTITRKIIVNK